MKLFVCLFLTNTSLAFALIQPVCPSPEFHVSEYLETAVELQSLGKDRAVVQLQLWGGDREKSMQVIILCRMLFAAEVGQKIVPPPIGHRFSFSASTVAEDWPLTPIAIFENVPFLVIKEIPSSEVKETAGEFLDRCVREQNWRVEKYQVKTQQQLNQAASHFVASTNWKLSESEQWRQPWLELKFLTQALIHPRSLPEKTSGLDETWSFLQKNYPDPLLEGTGIETPDTEE